MEELKHFLHYHPLILNEVETSPIDKYIECAGCKQPINKLIDSFYSCANLPTSTSTSSSSRDCISFFMHKTCAELPRNFKPLKLKYQSLILDKPPYRKQEFWPCEVCGSLSQGLVYSDNFGQSIVCLKCVTSELRSLEHHNLCHPSHNHPLTLFQKPSLFLCDACNTTAADLSYVCTECSFSIHKSCASAPPTYKCKFHDKHPLVLVFSLPEEHREFVQSCSICSKYINPIYWLYYCANCRFFAHLKCASSTEMLSKNEDEATSGESNLVHFPYVDESSLNEMMQQFIKATNSTHLDDLAVATPPNQINHWAHKQHQLVLTKTNAISPFDLNSKLLHEVLLICDGCTKPIYSSDDIFYECNLCNYVLHLPCAQFPKEMRHPVAGKLVAQEAKPYEYFQCGGCGHTGNGICFHNEYTTEGFHIGCVSLPKVIKHEAHHHPLYQCKHPDDIYCNACIPKTPPVSIMFGCERCSFYIHMRCALRPRIVTHRWDPHPLSLIISSQDITDHPHEFRCEFCSERISPNTWFYHCNDCDQSFHMDCIYRIYRYPYYKFGATNINSEKYPHPHGLTFLLNKKKRSCNKCGKDMRGERVLECSPCQFMVHAKCR